MDFIATVLFNFLEGVFQIFKEGIMLDVMEYLAVLHSQLIGS